MRHNHIIEQVPINYYQNGVRKNLLQRTWHMNKLKTILDFTNIQPERILDVGCASGWFVSQLAERFPRAKCFGIDLYAKGINHAKILYPSVRFRVADAHRLPFKTNSFHLVVCTEVLEHVDDPKTVLLEIRRVLKKNGSAILELDSGSLLFSISWYLWRKWKGKVWNDSHLHAFTVQKLERLLAACNFSILKKKRFNFGMAMVFLAKKS